jgi:hypothetical protein
MEGFDLIALYDLDEVIVCSCDLIVISDYDSYTK